MENRIHIKFHYHYGLFKILTIKIRANMEGNLRLQFSAGYIIKGSFLLCVGQN